MSTPKNPIADFAPKLVEITDKVLFGDVWERPQLSKRDHEIIELITHLAFYAGWPNAMSAATKVKELFRK